MSSDTKLVKRYQAGIERALALFDPTSEWADYIAFLSRLLRSLQGGPEDVEIPSKSIISKYLGQCLQPSLPSGVHQKALEVYDLIFSLIGLSGLSRDLPLYLPGLSHTLAFASLSTRPYVLSLYDDHILKLPSRTIRPALKAIILSILPGLEEETSEDFDRTLNTFNRFRSKFTDDQNEEFFWQTLFVASISSANRRPGVLVYLTRYLPKLLGESQASTNGNQESSSGQLTNEMKVVVSPEPGLLVRCFATGLQDEQLLIQRGFLDLLVTHLPVNAPIFIDQAHSNDLDVLVKAASTVVLRRDMGLNRRLWTWFTGSELKSPVLRSDMSPNLASQNTQSQLPESSQTYFSQYGLASLIRGIHGMIDNASNDPVEQARPFRIALSLMDKWEIGSPVIEAVFIPLLRTLQNYQSMAPSQDAFDEVFRSANVFFDGVEGRLIWGRILELLSNQDLDLIRFIISNFHMEEEEMLTVHIPTISLIVADHLQQMLDHDDSKADLDVQVLSKTAETLEMLLSILPIGILNQESPQSNEEDEDAWLSRAQSFYQDHASTTKSVQRPLNAARLSELLFSTVAKIFLSGLSPKREDPIPLRNSEIHQPANGTTAEETSGIPSYSSDISSRRPVALVTPSLLMKLCICIERTIVLTGERARSSLIEKYFSSSIIQSIISSCSSANLDFPTVITVAKVVSTLCMYNAKLLSTTFACEVVPLIVQRLWDFLSPSSPHLHIETVENIWRLHRLTHELHIVDSTIISLLVSEAGRFSPSQSSISRLAVLWTHSRSLSKQNTQLQASSGLAGEDDVLDLLKDCLLHIIDTMDATNMSDIGSIWLQSLPNLLPAFQLVSQTLNLELDESELTALFLQRTRKLLRLTKSSGNQWTTFLESGSELELVLRVCKKLISNASSANPLAIEALEILQLLHGDGSAAIASETIQMLVERLPHSYEAPILQEALLETLLNVYPEAKDSKQHFNIIPVLLNGLASPKTDKFVDKWVSLLCNVVKHLTTTNLLPNLLKITATLCQRINAYFNYVQQLYTNDTGTPLMLENLELPAHNPERSIVNLLAGLEFILARAHQQVLDQLDERSAHLTGSSTDLMNMRSVANDHLTVVLCMQDAIKICTNIWLWRSTGRPSTILMDLKSFQHMTMRLRGRSRRILENLINAEPQESLETLIGTWVERRIQNQQHSQILDLFQTLDGARPKFMMPAIFNAIYNRTNPAALDQSQKSSLSIDITAPELISFLNDYTSALEDDLLEEIWTDCTTFLREVLANPMPHRQILVRLLGFIAVLCRTMENTNFGEAIRMRKDMADICARLSTAIFTIKPAGLLEAVESSPSENDSTLKGTKRFQLDSGNAIETFRKALPDISPVLISSDRLTSVSSGIALNITGPLLHSRTFPQNVSLELLELLQVMSATPTAAKTWKKDVLDAYNNPRFFESSDTLVATGWLPLIRQLSLSDKNMMLELLNRLTPPAAAGLMFGVGASAARLEADRRTQLDLRRVAILLLSMDRDAFLIHLRPLLFKVEELLAATPESSPSTAVRGDIYLVFRTLLLSFDQLQLASIWSILDVEMRKLCMDMLSETDHQYTKFSQIQGAKLLDLLLLMKPDEFQLHEWLFVTDTIDAVYPPNGAEATALADVIAASTRSVGLDVPTSTPVTSRKPWLCSPESRIEEKWDGLLIGFFGHLSIRVFENNYGMQGVDYRACRQDLLADLFAG